MIKKNHDLEENIAKLLYRLVDNLFYFDDNERGLRLYVSIVLKEEIFKLVHNEMGYSNYTRTYKRLINGLYIYNIIIKLYKFIRYYPYYQLN